MSSRAIRRLLLENWGLKLLSLAFATLLWMFVVGEKRSEVSLSLPLELTGIPQEMVIVSRVPEAIRVRLNGPRTLMAAVNPQQLSVSLDLDGIQAGISAFEILPSRLNVPRGVEVTYISPSVITLEADHKIRKTVPVKARTRGTPAEGFELAETRVEPTSVELEGAERVLKQLKEAPTEVIDVTDLDGSVTRPVEFVLPDPSLQPVEVKTARLEVVIREMRAEREFVEVPVVAPDAAWEILPPSVNLKVEGTVRAITRLASKDLSVTAIPGGKELPTGPIKVSVKVPANVNLISVQPVEVILRYLEPPQPEPDGVQELGPPLEPALEPVPQPTDSGEQ